MHRILDKGLAMCAAKSHILKTERSLLCPKLLSRLPFSVKSCLLNCFISSKRQCLEERLPYPCSYCQCLYVPEILLLLL